MWMPGARSTAPRSGMSVMRSTTTPSSARICSMRSALPLPSAAMNTLKPVALERVEPLRERVGVADDGIERARREHRRVGRVGHREHRNRLRLRVREQAVERAATGGACRRRRRGLPHVVASVCASAASSSSSSWARSRSRRGSMIATSADARQQIGQEVLVGGQPRQPRLHAVERVALREPLPLLATPRLGLRGARGRGPAPRRSAAARAPGRSTTRSISADER